MTEIIYIGRRKLVGGKPGYGFITPERLDNVNDDGFYMSDTIDHKASFFKMKKPSHVPLIIGGIYDAGGNSIFEEDRLTSIRVDEIKFLRMSKSDFTANWKAHDDAIEQEKRTESAVKFAENNSELNHAIATLRRNYKQITPGFRRGFQLWLLAELEKK